MAVDRDEVLRVAALARLELGDDEVDALVRELGDTLSHVAELRASSFELRISSFELRTAGAPPADGAPEGDGLAGDVEGMAPDFRDGFFRVPRLGSHQDEDG